MARSSKKVHQDTGGETTKWREHYDIRGTSNWKKLRNTYPEDRNHRTKKAITRIKNHSTKRPKKALLQRTWKH